MSRLDSIRENTIQAVDRVIGSHLPDETGGCPVCGTDCWVVREVGQKLAPDLLGWRWAGWPPPEKVDAHFSDGAGG